MTDALTDIKRGTYFGRKYKHYVTCPCGWKKEIIYGFGTDITFEEFWAIIELHKKECGYYTEKEKMEMEGY